MIAPPNNREAVRYEDGSTRDIIEVILEADALADRSIRNVECLRGRTDLDTLYNVWAFIRKNVRYRADRAGREQVKTPAALFASGVGDCKSFSIAEAAILRSLGFSGIRYRFAAYSPRDYTHVYVVCKLKGKDVILDAVHTSFDQEVRYHHKKDIPAAVLSGVAGLPQPHVGGGISDVLTIGGLALGGWLLYELLK